MLLEDLRSFLTTGFGPEQAVLVLGAVNTLVNSQRTHDLGREMVIRCLAKKDLFPPGLLPLLESLVGSVGLIPYLSKDVSTFEEQLMLEAHRTPAIGKVDFFHTLQLQIYRELRSKRNVVLSATTSVGKSAIVDAIIASGDHKHLTIIVPTIALIDETRRRIIETFGSRYAIVTHPTQVSSRDKATVFVLTQERALNRDDLQDVSFFVIDEFYKLDLQMEKSIERAVDLNLCFHKLSSNGAQFYLIGPHVDGINGLASKREFLFLPSHFSTIALDIVQYGLPRDGGEREEKLIELCEELTSPTLIFCQSPGSAKRAAETLLEAEGLLPETDLTWPAVEWLEKEYPEEWIVTHALRRGVGIHHGSIPRALQQYMVKAFETGAIKFLICTSTLIEGVNTVAENVIIFDKRIKNTGIDYFTFRNIAGRAGRMRRYFVGRVYVLEEQPEPDTCVIEVAVGTQSETTPMSLLLDLEDDDLTPASKTRVESVTRESPLSLETLRANRRVHIEKQYDIYDAIWRDTSLLGRPLAWRGVPDSPQLLAVCNLIVDYLDSEILKGYQIFSGKQLQAKLYSVENSKSLREVIDDFVEHRRRDASVSDAVELALRFLRKYVGYTFPQSLMAISHIQGDVLRKIGVEPGNYEFYAAKAESLFMERGLFALDEYGIPPETAIRFAPVAREYPTLDSAIELVKRMDLRGVDLTKFERDLIDDLRASLLS
ncbi:helicase domain protein (plasmid) [Rhizobium leguminosarum bv. trifolii WSM1325]|uniref:Helicase domain protein n=1 Tax=Rhizobium leguminosarum bv. trifolii (strain WSM1325) TaxID=395491 RepID=C6B4U9_RHILS|nr:helicase domain protein [Rhizobium leguminosarum bv. trifolii WSM1325]